MANSQIINKSLTKLKDFKNFQIYKEIFIFENIEYIEYNVKSEKFPFINKSFASLLQCKKYVNEWLMDRKK